MELLLSIHHAAMGEYIEATWGPWDDDAQRSYWDERQRGGLLQVVVVSGSVAGLLEVRESEENAEVVNIELAPHFQGRGLGTAILTGIQQAAVRRGAAVVLQVLTVNSARHLDMPLGFTATGETEWHVQMRWSC